MPTLYFVCSEIRDLTAEEREYITKYSQDNGARIRVVSRLPEGQKELVLPVKAAKEMTEEGVEERPKRARRVPKNG